MKSILFALLLAHLFAFVAIVTTEDLRKWPGRKFN